jgi:hypothetical protein
MLGTYGVLNVSAYSPKRLLYLVVFLVPQVNSVIAEITSYSIPFWKSGSQQYILLVRYMYIQIYTGINIGIGRCNTHSEERSIPESILFLFPRLSAICSTLLKPPSFQYYRQADCQEGLCIINFFRKMRKCVVSPFSIADELQ